MKDRAIFIDKDGTLIHDVPFNVAPEKIVLYDDAIDALSRLKQEGFKIIVITNQSGVAHGYFQEQELKIVEDTLKRLLNVDSLLLDGFYYCPHSEEGKVKEYSYPCLCRKPLPGLIYRASEDYTIDLSSSWMIGDILNDVEAGNRAGCNTVLINNGGETEWKPGAYRSPNIVVSNLLEASDRILDYERQRKVHKEKAENLWNR